MKFTQQEDDYIRENYLLIPTKRISKNLGRSESSARQRIKLLGLAIPKHITAKFKASSQIKKGATPPNKGKKQSDYMTADAIARTAKTRFKKGNKPHNCYDEVGKITIRHEADKKGGRPYKFICLEIGNWMPLHTHLWELENGKVPKGCCLWFKDGDSLNADLTNIECISRSENLARNHDYDNPTDKRIASYIATTSKKLDRELQAIVLQNHKIIDTKRTQLLLNRKIKSLEHGTEQANRP